MSKQNQKIEDSSRDISRGDIETTLELKEHVKSIPMIGWHDPIAKFKHEGKDWELCIAGGCQSVWVTSPNGRSYSVSIGQLLPAIVAKIELIEQQQKEK